MTGAPIRIQLEICQLGRHIQSIDFKQHHVILHRFRGKTPSFRLPLVGDSHHSTNKHHVIVLSTYNYIYTIFATRLTQ